MKGAREHAMKILEDSELVEVPKLKTKSHVFSCLLTCTWTGFFVNIPRMVVHGLSQCIIKRHEEAEIGPQFCVVKAMVPSQTLKATTSFMTGCWQYVSTKIKHGDEKLHWTSPSSLLDKFFESYLSFCFSILLIRRSFVAWECLPGLLCLTGLIMKWYAIRTCTPIELIETTWIIPYSHGIAYHILRDHVSGEWLIRVIKILTEHRICGPLGSLVQSNVHTRWTKGPFKCYFGIKFSVSSSNIAEQSSPFVTLGPLLYHNQNILWEGRVGV